MATVTIIADSYWVLATSQHSTKCLKHTNPFPPHNTMRLKNDETQSPDEKTEARDWPFQHSPSHQMLPASPFFFSKSVSKIPPRKACVKVKLPKNKIKFTCPLRHVLHLWTYLFTVKSCEEKTVDISIFPLGNGVQRGKDTLPASHSSSGQRPGMNSYPNESKAWNLFDDVRLSPERQGLHPRNTGPTWWDTSGNYGQ